MHYRRHSFHIQASIKVHVILSFISCLLPTATYASPGVRPESRVGSPFSSFLSSLNSLAELSSIQDQGSFQKRTKQHTKQRQQALVRYRVLLKA
ncbi:hypothetical protein GE21DRAFT_1089946 [Neurospora crassa]|nr:hypothetical protein GE21DRAFT_1089946 [Neurospora crassa]